MRKLEKAEVARVYSSMADLRAMLDAHEIQCPTADIEKSGKVVLVSEVAGIYMFNGLLFHCYDRDYMNRLCRTEAESFDDILLNSGIVRFYVTNAWGDVVPAEYQLSSADGRLFVVMGGRVLAVLGKYEELVA